MGYAIVYLTPPSVHLYRERFIHFYALLLKVTQSRKQIMISSILPRTKLTILSKEHAQDSEFCSFFGRIEETINCFRDCSNKGQTRCDIDIRIGYHRQGLKRAFSFSSSANTFTVNSNTPRTG